MVLSVQQRWSALGRQAGRNRSLSVIVRVMLFGLVSFARREKSEEAQCAQRRGASAVRVRAEANEQGSMSRAEAQRKESEMNGGMKR